MPLVLLRHASAGSRETWIGDDRERPLDDRGIRQARDLVALLGDLAVSRIVSSPYLRCLQTVELLAGARSVEVELRDELGEERQLDDGIELVRGLAGADVVVCGHGGLQTAIHDAPRWKKGAAFLVDIDLRVLEVRRA